MPVPAKKDYTYGTIGKLKRRAAEGLMPFNSIKKHSHPPEAHSCVYGSVPAEECKVSLYPILLLRPSPVAIHMLS
jgi:hypothetical protein